MLSPEVSRNILVDMYLGKRSVSLMKELMTESETVIVEITP